MASGRRRRQGRPPSAARLAEGVLIAAGSAQIDAAIALCVAVERAENRPEPVRLVGWL